MQVFVERETKWRDYDFVFCFQFYGDSELLEHLKFGWSVIIWGWMPCISPKRHIPHSMFSQCHRLDHSNRDVALRLYVHAFDYRSVSE